MAKVEGRRGKETTRGIRGAALGRDPARPVGRLTLAFQAAAALEHVRKALYHDISALAVANRTLFCACDETATVERLVLDDSGTRFERHMSFAIGDILDLPEGPEGEMDIEGLAICDGHLWITGSHSLKRGKLKDGQEDLKALRKVEWDANRGFLGRVPLRRTQDGAFEPVGRMIDRAGKDAGRAASLKWNKAGHTAIRTLLAGDKLLKPYMDVPSKENGFDVEGLAMAGDRIFLGLRGPVIGSHALMVELKLKATRKGRLKPQELSGGDSYRLHALDLDGLGIRDMVVSNGRLIVLAGATMNFEGPQTIHVVDGLPGDGGPIPQARVRHAFDIPVTPGCDHAEGIAPVTIGGQERLMVVYDSPAPERVDDEKHTLVVDLFEMP